MKKLFLFILILIHNTNEKYAYARSTVDTLKIGEGWNEFTYTLIGMTYYGTDTFAYNTTKSINRISLSKAGSIVLLILMLSESNFYILNEGTCDDCGSIVSATSFKGFPGGGGEIRIGMSDTPNHLSHELYHGYLHEKEGPLPENVSYEVEAYLFEDIVCLQANLLFWSRNFSNECGRSYVDAHQNMLDNGYNETDFANAINNFKFSQRNNGGIYNNYSLDFDPNSEPPHIAEFLPYTKQ